jgi:CheY-like chemotaxis protein
MSANGVVLIVDDEGHIRELVHDLIISFGYRPVVVENGLEALAIIRRNPPDIVLLDVQMPVMDGMQVLETMKGDSQMKRIPVVVMSAFDDMDRIVRCVSLGAEDYLTKPLKPALLRARIEGSLKRLDVLREEQTARERLDTYVAGLASKQSDRFVELPPPAEPANSSLERASAVAPPPDPVATASAVCRQSPVPPLEQSPVRPRGLPPWSRKSAVAAFAAVVVLAVITALRFGPDPAHSTSASLNAETPVALAGLPDAVPEPGPIQARPSAIGSEPTALGPEQNVPASGPRNRGKLHVVSIGVSKYQDTAKNLRCAANDALTMARELCAHANRDCFDLAPSVTIIDENATRGAVLQALVSVNAGQYDLVVISFAGHGEVDDSGNFYFAPHEFRWDQPHVVTGISWGDIQTALKSCAGQLVVIMDACNSGAITHDIAMRGSGDLKKSVERVVNDFRRSTKGLVVMASTFSNEGAAENAALGHGYLTMALLEGITGRYIETGHTETPLPRASSAGISLFALDNYATERMKELRGGRQAVFTRHSPNVQTTDIPIAKAGP